jgi:hypothetical protein
MVDGKDSIVLLGVWTIMGTRHLLSLWDLTLK